MKKIISFGKALMQQLTLKSTMMAISSFFLLSHCNKTESPPPTYTVSGRILNGTTMMPLFINQPIQLEVTTSIQYGTPVDNAILGSCTVDDSGKFSFTYSQTNITNKGAYVRIDAGLNFLGKFPVNKNADQNVYLSSMGSVKIYFNTKNPLASRDTLYLLYGLGNIVFGKDTILKSVNGYYKTVRVPMPTVVFRWGRNYSDFVGHINEIEESITGDPVIDSLLINY